MPDWSYHTIFKPLLFRLNGPEARDLTLHAIGGLSRIPGGTFVIRTMGHMEMSPHTCERACRRADCLPGWPQRRA